MEIPIYIADTPCIVRIYDADDHMEVYAIDDPKGERRLTVSRELLDDITDYLKDLAKAVTAGGHDTQLREGLPEPSMGPSETPGAGDAIPGE
ncbi:MAG TPA: hypothetical protein VH621_06840 [Nitrososphaera sp.]|jgi:hypothetical protein